ncbi:hypothetical protein LINGRAHAP2_LOCUS17997 [Linum grandiflorum]
MVQNRSKQQSMMILLMLLLLVQDQHCLLGLNDH